ncbi:DNA-binding protein RFX2 [Musca vetustissima]|uniref:DNA-binding protein RFX2 n=1 Tax=Musca vetustissima TaxID=27455 RepID=UPI002AB65976|nr:DNA-binding protein RFX2 [Musca vetustissima]
MHSRLLLDQQQQQHLQQQLQHLNTTPNFQHHFLEKCRCASRTQFDCIQGHTHHFPTGQQYHHQQQHHHHHSSTTRQSHHNQLLTPAYQYSNSYYHHSPPSQQQQQHQQHLRQQYCPANQLQHTRQQQQQNPTATTTQQYLHSHTRRLHHTSAVTSLSQQQHQQQHTSTQTYFKQQQHHTIVQHLYQQQQQQNQYHHRHHSTPQHPPAHHPAHNHPLSLHLTPHPPPPCARQPSSSSCATLVANVPANCCTSIAATAAAAATSSLSPANSCSSPATIATPPTPSPLPLPPPNPSATMYRRHNNLSYCGVSQEPGQNYQVQYVDTELYHSNSSQSQMTYPFCPIGDYQPPNGQSYYTTTHTANYSTAVPLNAPAVPHHSTLPYIVPTEETLLLNASSQTHSRDSPHSLTEVPFIPDTHSSSQTPTSTTANSVNVGSIGANGGGGGAGTGGGSSGGSDVSPDNEHGLMGNTNKIASATIKWLSRNYETAEGVSLPRSTLYNHYIQHCNESKIEPVNAASFGKLIRSVFSGLRTRRLGTRGNSKYHYYGIRIKPESILNHMMDEKPNTFQTHHPHAHHHQHHPHLNPANLTSDQATNNNAGNSGGGLHHSRGGKKTHTFKSETHEACGHFLGNGSGAIPPFPPIELDNTFDSELTPDDVETFRSMYREHCENFLDAVLNLDFNTIEFLWRDFWRENAQGDECHEEDKYLSKTKLYLLCHCAGVQKFVREVDYQFYQNMVDVIIPDVLRSIPNSLTQAIRNFAKNMEIWLCESMIGVPERMVQIKSSAVSAFCQTLRRYTSLNHLAQAARAVLQNNSQITQMLNDLNRVDFHNVQEQAAWVCQCDPSLVQRLENDFKTTLQQQCSLEQWAAWLQVVVDSVLQEHFGKPSYAKAARQFLLKWSFYSSMIIRDLTLRSASSFGSFHLIRLLYDEYMFYLIEHKVAEAHQKTAIAVICDLKQKDVEFDFGYQLEFITSDSMSSERGATKRLKHE